MGGLAHAPEVEAVQHSSSALLKACWTDPFWVRLSAASYLYGMLPVGGEEQALVLLEPA